MKQVKVVVRLLYTLLHRLLMLILYRHHESPLLIQLQTERDGVCGCGAAGEDLTAVAERGLWRREIDGEGLSSLK
ncbi:hypothetical protein TSUD_101610 [Trifolium subterraneum]|uniref:Uncharacterized protein n=1 Tax=Trifolium subterraneum TaxID=3900 RepID=A0A2Z6N904_TRISU|nr:hypothetical protein TSUD_101610 [Trifolium subterraneum]